MNALNLAGGAVMGGRKAAALRSSRRARLPQSKSGRSKLRHYKELPNYGDMQLSCCYGGGPAC